MAGHASYIHTDLHAPSLSPVDAAVCRLCGHHELRPHLILVNNVLPAETVTVLLLNTANNHDPASLRDQIQILHDLSSVHGRYDTAALVRHTSSADLGLILIALIRVKIPVFYIADTYRINMGIISDNPVPASHISDHITLRIDLHLIKSHVPHLCGDGLNMSLLITALPRIPHNGSQKSIHIRPISLSRLFNFLKIQHNS